MICLSITRRFFLIRWENGVLLCCHVVDVAGNYNYSRRNFQENLEVNLSIEVGSLEVKKSRSQKKVSKNTVK